MFRHHLQANRQGDDWACNDEAATQETLAAMMARPRCNKNNGALLAAQKLVGSMGNAHDEPPISRSSLPVQSLLRRFSSVREMANAHRVCNSPYDGNAFSSISKEISVLLFWLHTSTICCSMATLLKAGSTMTRPLSLKAATTWVSRYKCSAAFLRGFIADDEYRNTVHDTRYRNRAWNMFCRPRSIEIDSATASWRWRSTPLIQ